MAEAKKRKVHGAEFKAKVGLEAVRGVKTINEIAQQHGVHPVMVSQWKKEILERAGTLFEGKWGRIIKLVKFLLIQAGVHNSSHRENARFLRRGWPVPCC
jgi:transposase